MIQPFFVEAITNNYSEKCSSCWCEQALKPLGIPLNVDLVIQCHIICKIISIWKVTEQ
jgi:hypothetical protein